MAKDARARKTKTRILQAAEELFLEQGYGETTLKDILARAHTSTGSFYHQLSGKPEVAEELCLACLESQLIAIRSVIPPPTPRAKAVEGVQSLIGGYLKWAIEKRHLVKLIATLLPHVREKTMSRIAAKEAAIDGMIAAWAKQLIKSGKMRDVPPRVISALLLGPTKTLFLDWVRGMSDVDPSAHEATLVEAACSVLLPLAPVKPSGPEARRPKRTPVAGKDAADLFGNT